MIFLRLGLMEVVDSSSSQGLPCCIAVVAIVLRLKNRIHHWGLCASQRYRNFIRHASESGVRCYRNSEIGIAVYGYLVGLINSVAKSA